MAYALVCDDQYQVDALTGAYVCAGDLSQMVIDPLVSLDPQVAATYLAGGFAVGLGVFGVAWAARVVIDFVRKS